MNTCASYVTVCVIVVRFTIQYTCMYSVSVSVSQISVLHVSSVLVTSIIMSVSAYALLFIHGILVFGQSVNGQMQNELACVRFESGKLYVCLIQL